jgi:hypothetical protein
MMGEVGGNKLNLKEEKWIVISIVSGAGNNSKGSYYASLHDSHLQTVQYSEAGEGGDVAEVYYSGASYPRRYNFITKCMLSNDLPVLYKV